jgi:MFS family permease
MACKSPGSQTIFRFNSWTASKHLTCDQRHFRGTGKFLALLVNSLTCFTMLNLSDLLGRRKVAVIASSLIIISLVLAYFMDNFYIKLILLGFAYGCEGTFTSLFNFIMNEASSNSLISP